MLHDSKPKEQTIASPYHFLSPTEILPCEQKWKTIAQSMWSGFQLLVQFVTNITKQGSYSEASFFTTQEYVLARGNMGCGDRDLWKFCDSKHSQHESNHLLGGDSDTYNTEQARMKNSKPHPCTRHHQIWPPWNFYLNYCYLFIIFHCSLQR